MTEASRSCGLSPYLQAKLSGLAAALQQMQRLHKHLPGSEQHFHTMAPRPLPPPGRPSLSRWLLLCSGSELAASQRFMSRNV